MVLQNVSLNVLSVLELKEFIQEQQSKLTHTLSNRRCVLPGRRYDMLSEKKDVVQEISVILKSRF